MDIELIYTIVGTEIKREYTGVTVIPDFTNGTITIRLPQTLGNYDDLFNDMKVPILGIEVKFTSFGSDREFKDLKMTNMTYTKTVDSTHTIGDIISLTFEYRTPR